MMRELRERARRMLLANVRRGRISGADGEREFVYICPSPTIYHHQWLWDSCFHAIVMARFDGALAEAELRTLLSQVRGDGFLPHLTNWIGLGSLPWLSQISRRFFGYGHHRQLTQPPVLGIAVEEVYRHTGDHQFVAESLPTLKRYYDHLAMTRDPDGDGLLAIIFPIESGMDHSPIYDAPLGLRAPSSAAYHVANLQLLVHCLRLGWDLKRIFAAGRFVVEDIGFNCLYAAGLRALSRLCALVADPAAERYAARGGEVERAILTRCYCAEDGLFYSVSGHYETPLRVKTVASLLPLLLESLPNAQAAALVSHLQNPASYAAPYPVPSVAQDEASFMPAATVIGIREGLRGRMRRPYAKYQLVWRGPTWVNTNWFLARGLRQHGFSEMADELTLKTADMVAKAGFWEFYHPITGQGLGAENFSWSTLVVDLLDALEGEPPYAIPSSGSAHLPAQPSLL